MDLFSQFSVHTLAREFVMVIFTILQKQIIHLIFIIKLDKSYMINKKSLIPN